MVGGKTKVLVVEDEGDARKMLCRRLLAAHEFEVFETADGAGVLDIAKRENPDVILLDVMMPGTDGLQVYQAIRQDPATKSMPVIFITALSQQVTMDQRGLELIAQAKHGFELDKNYRIVGKPYEPEDLMAEIRRFVKKKKA